MRMRHLFLCYECKEYFTCCNACTDNLNECTCDECYGEIVEECKIKRASKKDIVILTLCK